MPSGTRALRRNKLSRRVKNGSNRPVVNGRSPFGFTQLAFVQRLPSIYPPGRSVRRDILREFMRDAGVVSLPVRKLVSSDALVLTDLSRPSVSGLRLMQATFSKEMLAPVTKKGGEAIDCLSNKLACRRLYPFLETKQA